MIFHPRIRHLADAGASFLGSGAIVSTSLSLSRNLNGFPFPSNASANLLESVMELGLAALGHDDVKALLPSMFQIKHSLLTESDRELLVERELLDPESAGAAAARMFICAENGSMSVLLNGDDHLKLRMIEAGPAFYPLWTRLSAIETALARYLRFTFHPRLGCLTSSPNLVGTGLKISFLLHLPALGIAGRIKNLLDKVEDAGLTAAPFFLVDKKAAGNLYRLTNKTTLGEREEDLGERMTRIAEAVAREEERTRIELTSRQKLLFLNACGRSYGLLRNAYLIPTAEALDALSIMKLGADCGVFHHFHSEDWAELMLKMQPAHLCCLRNAILSPLERGEFRASLFRERLNGPKPAPSSPTA